MKGIAKKLLIAIVGWIVGKFGYHRIKKEKPSKDAETSFDESQLAKAKQELEEEDKAFEALSEEGKEEERIENMDKP